MNTAKNGVMGCWSAGVWGRTRPSITPFILAAMLAFSLPALAAHQAADDASASVYDAAASWVSGANGGYGFGVWTNIQEDNGGWAGFFVANTTDNPSLGGIASGPSNRAWATYANGPNFNQTVAFRELTDGVLVSGQTFTVYFENGDVAADGSCGFCLRTGFVAGVCDDYNVGRQFEFGFIGGSNNYFVVDGTSGGNQFDTGVGWTTNGLKIALTMTSAVNYSLEVVVLDVKATSRFSRALAGSGGIRSVALYNRNTDVGGDAGNVYFNLMSVTGDPPSPYALAPSAQDGGGRRITNASLQVVDASVGGPFGLLTNAQVHVLKAGYPAQLYDFAGLQAYAEPATIPEANTRQLGARWIYDDWTGYALEGTPDWSIASGPLASISVGGLATASNVYQDTPAGGRAAYGGYTDVVALLVVNTNWDDYYAYADDQVDDAWQVDQFGENDPDALGDEDPDTDGRNNRMEWITGTLPTNDESYFAMWIERVPGVQTQADVVFDPTFTSRTYRVRYRDVLTTNAWRGLAGYAETTSGTERTVRDLSITNERIYYRVLVGFPRVAGEREAFDSDAAGWVDRDPDEMTLSFSASGHPGGSLRGTFAAQGFPAIETDALRADSGSSGGIFVGVYPPYVSLWRFDFYAEDVLPSDTIVRFSDGAVTFSRSVSSQITSVGSWHAVEVPLEHSGSWLGGSGAQFTNALRVAGLQWVEIQITRNGTAEEDYYLDNFEKAEE